MNAVFIVSLAIVLCMTSPLAQQHCKTQRSAAELSCVPSTLAKSTLSSLKFTKKETSDSTALEDIIAELAISLERRLPLDHKKSKVVLGKLTFGESDVPSPFMHYFAIELAIALKRFTSLSVIDREEMMEVIRTRSPFLTRGNTPVSEHGTTEILQSDLFIRGSCRKKEKLLEV